MIPTKIVVIGAGSASFGLNTLGSLMRSERLRGSQIALVDRNPDALANMRRLADRLNTDWGAGMVLTSHLHHKEALEGAGFVVSAIEVPPREKLWRMDYDITLRHGVRQPYAENGGPGGFFHAARNIGPVLEIVHDMEQICPEAWFINFSNPMVRVCDAIHRYSKIKVVGLCHQIYAGYGMVGFMIADKLGIQLPPDGFISTHADPKYWRVLHQISHRAAELVDIKAAGLNHFTWMLDVRDRRTGEDLYPAVRAGWAKSDPRIEPLTRRVFDAFGIMPIPGDEHLCEYLPWVSDPTTQPWDKYDLSLYDWDRAEKGRDEGHQEIALMGQGLKPIDPIKEASSEGALEVIERLANLPVGAMVETPVVLSGMGVQPVAVGPLPEGVAEICRRELAVVKLCVDSAVHGDPQLALQALLLDPIITDLDKGREILDDYLVTYKDYLPQYWK